MICRVDSVSFRYPHMEVDAVREIALEVYAGTHVAIVGPNGAGKSTLLRLITGIIRPREGSVDVLGRPVQEWNRRQLARHVAVVGQTEGPRIPLSVRELVEMGRHPYTRPWAALTRHDRDIVDNTLGWADLSDLAERDIRELSGGELQRARLARALAQAPQLLLLDEPAAHLDMGHEMKFFELVAQQSMQQHLTVVSVTHHLNTSARFADRMVLLKRGAIIAEGPPRDVMSARELERAFEWPVAVQELGELGPHAIPMRDASGGAEPQ
jgi:iron complex transport system ATP-binding protein